MHPNGPSIGIVANPASARDIRRVIANAGSLQVADRVNIVLRVLAAAGACGVRHAWVMPDKSGIRPMLARGIERERGQSPGFPSVEFLEMPVTSTVDDSFRATRMMREAGVAAIIVLGGDGTHRAVVRECGDVPIAGLSTGTNNAFPELREPTLTGMAVGLHACGRLPPDRALAWNKRLDVSINGGERHDIALVDAAVSTERHVGARAIWRTESLRELYVAFADPEVIGMSAIAGLLEPVGRREAGGLAVRMADADGRRALVLDVPIAPGMLQGVGIASWERMPAGRTFRVRQAAGVVALDGEREMPFSPGDEVTVTVRDHAFRTVDVSRCLRAAAADGLLRR